jgi:hypothetical protein
MMNALARTGEDGLRRRLFGRAAEFSFRLNGAAVFVQRPGTGPGAAAIA